MPSTETVASASPLAAVTMSQAEASDAPALNRRKVTSVIRGAGHDPSSVWTWTDRVAEVPWSFRISTGWPPADADWGTWKKRAEKSACSTPVSEGWPASHRMFPRDRSAPSTATICRGKTGSGTVALNVGACVSHAARLARRRAARRTGPARSRPASGGVADVASGERAVAMTGAPQKEGFDT